MTVTTICNINGHLINHFMHADDLVLISPSSASLSQLLHECEKFGTRHDVNYNAKKSAVMMYRLKQQTQIKRNNHEHNNSNNNNNKKHNTDENNDNNIANNNANNNNHINNNHVL